MASRGRGARNKGAQFERDIAKLLTEATGVEFKRGLGQTRGGGTEVPDVLPEHDGLRDSIHIECKRQIRCNIKAALRQAVTDIGEKEKKPIVITKDDRDDTLVTMKIEDFLELFTLWTKTIK